MFNAKVVHILAVVTALLTSLSAGVLAATDSLPASWKPDVLLGLALLGIVLTVLHTASTQVQVAKIQAISGPNAGLDDPKGLQTVSVDVSPAAVEQELA